MLIVEKFGGTSVADAQRISRAAQKMVEAAQKGNRVVGVVSAQGDLTDRLLEKIRSVTQTPSGRESDACVSAGEQISAALLAMAVQRLGHDAVSLTGWQAGICTDGVYGNARICKLEAQRIQRELEEGKIIIVAGFQGVDAEGNITTLGRGGSDTTAVTLAALLGADICRIYTDVDGVDDKAPRQYSDAVKLKHIGYDEMLAMCHGGAQVLHDRCVELARECGIRLEVRSAFSEDPGTIVGVLE